MAISYVLKQCVNPKDRFAAKKWYAKAKSQQELSFQKMCNRISFASSATKGDVELSINGLIFQMVDTLSDGNIVRLGDFGSFRVSLSSGGAEKQEDFHSKMITKARLIFTPGPLLKDMLTTASFRLIDKETVVVAPEVPEVTE